MRLTMWQLFLNGDLPPAVREALTIADRAASAALSEAARRLAGCALIASYGLSVADAAELVAVDSWRLRCGPELRAA